MRSFLAAAAVIALLPGCTATSPRSGSPEPTPAVSSDPRSWVMSPDSFGPISVETSRAQALATGFYVPAPSPCSERRLDSRDQTYAETGVDVDGDGDVDKELAKPALPSIRFGDNDRPEFIDPAPHTATDRGIRKADSLSRLQITYGDELIPAADRRPDGGTFAVNGQRSHLLFAVMFGKVVGFYIVDGRVDDQEDVLVAAGNMTKHDDLTLGRQGPC